jgi:hypothetical protein
MVSAPKSRYFDGLKRARAARTTKVTVRYVHGAPLAVVKAAAAKRRAMEYDEVWAVCDVDEFDISDAACMARQHQVELALSQPCFEVWLILHLSDCNAHLDDATHAKARLGKVLSGWDKTDLRFGDFGDGVDDAVRRAKSLGEPPEANPSTTVWRLVESLRRPRPGESGA